MTTGEATDAVRRGASFGDVFPLLQAADADPFREWFVRTPGVPNLAARGPKPRPTGDVCRLCGGANLVRTGTCETCFDCGTSAGGCS